MIPRQQRERTARLHQRVRLGIQILFLVVAPGLFAAAFNGAKTLFSSLGMIQGVALTTFMALLLAVLAFTIVFGRFFCGYACAFGTLGDVLFNGAQWVRNRLSWQTPALPRPVVRGLSLVKYTVLAAICGACFVGVWDTVAGYSPWVAFAGLTNGSFDGIEGAAFALLAVVAVLMMLKERAFCQFLCPLGALFTLMPILGFSRFTRQRQRCASRCGRCVEGCPVDIWPDADDMAQGECISCGRCADGCPLANVNLVAIERRLEAAEAAVGASAADLGAAAAADQGAPTAPALVGATTSDAGSSAAAGVATVSETSAPAKDPERWILWRGTGLPGIAAKASALLALCWLLGATRYLPSASDVLPAMPFPL